MNVRIAKIFLSACAPVHHSVVCVAYVAILASVLGMIRFFAYILLVFSVFITRLYCIDYLLTGGFQLY